MEVYTAGKILADIQSDGRIPLNERELGAVRKYRDEEAKGKLPDPKSNNITIAFFVILFIGFVIYRVWFYSR